MPSAHENIENILRLLPDLISSIDENIILGRDFRDRNTPIMGKSFQILKLELYGKRKALGILDLERDELDQADPENFKKTILKPKIFKLLNPE